MARWLLEQDWVSRHFAWQYMERAATTRRLRARLAAVLASDQIIDGMAGPVEVMHDRAIALPRPPDRWKQATLHRYFKYYKVKKSNGRQLTLNHFWRSDQ